METDSTDTRRGRFAGTSLRVRTARGTLINGAFLTLVNALGMARGFIVAGFLTTEEYGVWGVLLAIVATLQILKQVGIGEKYVQQDDPDQRAAFQLAWTFELCVSVGFVALGAILVIAAGAIYSIPELVAPGLVLLLAFPLQALQFPLVWFYRRMDFAKQRTLQAVDPIVAFVVTIALAIGGFGYWSIVAGSVVGAAAGAAAALINRPYGLEWRFDRSRVGEFFGFSWPLFVAGLSAVVTGNGLIAAGKASVGLAGIGVIAICAQVAQFADRADKAISDTMYPAICAVKDRADLLLESFVKSNRIALMWAVPFGVGVALFSEDILVRVLGDEWAPGVDLLRATAVTLALHQIGFNWSAFYRARGETAPIAIAGVVGIATFGAILVPLLLTYGLGGLAVGILAAEVVHTIMRLMFLRRLFPAFTAARHFSRSITPVVVPTLAVLAVRQVESGDGRTLSQAAAEAALYVLLTVASTWALERPLVREAFSYLRGAQPAVA